MCHSENLLIGLLNRLTKSLSQFVYAHTLTSGEGYVVGSVRLYSSCLLIWLHSPDGSTILRLAVDTHPYP